MPEYTTSKFYVISKYLILYVKYLDLLNINYDSGAHHPRARLCHQHLRPSVPLFSTFVLYKDKSNKVVYKDETIEELSPPGTHHPRAF